MPIAQSKSTAQSTYLSAGFWARSLGCMVSNTAILERTSQIARYLKCQHGVPTGVSTILEISEHVERAAGRAEQHEFAGLGHPVCHAHRLIHRAGPHGKARAVTR